MPAHALYLVVFSVDKQTFVGVHLEVPEAETHLIFVGKAPSRIHFDAHGVLPGTVGAPQRRVRHFVKEFKVLFGATFNFARRRAGCNTIAVFVDYFADNAYIFVAVIIVSYRYACIYVPLAITDKPGTDVNSPQIHRQRLCLYKVDVAVDVSESMFFHEERAARTRGLLQFCLLSAIGTGAQVKIHAVNGPRITPLDQEDVLSGQWEAQLQSLPPDESMPSISIWRPNGMKIFISDLLYPGEPDNLLETMASLKGMSVILAPTLQEEAELPAGNARLKNCESGHLRRQLITPSLSRRYARAYAAHFELWISACLRRQTVLARVPCKGTLTEALSGEALRQGAVELS